MDPEEQPRYRRLWMEFEVEVTDEMALRSFDLHPVAGPDGETAGLLDMARDQRIGYALGHVAASAWIEMAPSMGVRWMGGGGPTVRPQDESGAYRELTLPEMPQRRNDGTEGPA